MHRIDGPGATVDKKFTEGDPAGGVPATVVTAAWMNDVQENILAVLTAAGVTPTKARAADLLDAIRGTTPGRLLNMQVFSASATYTPTPGTNSIFVEVIGAGGGGGGVAATGAATLAVSGGGGGGGYACSRLTTGFSGVAVTIGAAGAAGAAGANAGGNGGSTSFGALLSAGGGGGGQGGPAVANSGTTISPGGTANVGASGNLINAGGIKGGCGIQSGSSIYAGSGGSSGRGTGVGGSGNQLGSSAAAAPGAAGGSGLVLVWEFA
jgi:hypothetical protein